MALQRSGEPFSLSFHLSILDKEGQTVSSDNQSILLAEVSEWPGDDLYTRRYTLRGQTKTIALAGEYSNSSLTLAQFLRCLLRH